jgi:hypothetical protein
MPYLGKKIDNRPAYSKFTDIAEAQPYQIVNGEDNCQKEGGCTTSRWERGKL